MERIKNEPRIDVVFDYKKVADEKSGREGTVWIRIQQKGGKRNYISTKVKVLPSQWSDNYHVIHREDAGVLNQKILDCMTQCRLVIKDHLQGVDAPLNEQTLQRMKADKHEATFLNFVRVQIEKNDMAEKTRGHHMTMYRSLEDFGKMRRFEDVTPDKIEKWLDIIRSRTVKRDKGGRYVEEPISQAEVYNYWKRFRKYVRIAQKKGLLSPLALGEIKVSKGEEADVTPLWDDEIEKWCNVKLDSARLKDSRDRFIVQMGTGLAYGDLVTKDFREHQVIEGQYFMKGARHKNNQKYTTVILPMAVKVLKRWNWQVPYIDNSDYNKELKVIAKLAGINKTIKSHVGRHTYACYCLLHRVGLEVIQKTLGHKSIRTTQIYAKVVDLGVIDAFKGMTKGKKRKGGD